MVLCAVKNILPDKPPHSIAMGMDQKDSKDRRCQTVDSLAIGNLEIFKKQESKNRAGQGQELIGIRVHVVIGIKTKPDTDKIHHQDTGSINTMDMTRPIAATFTDSNSLLGYREI